MKTISQRFYCNRNQLYQIYEKQLIQLDVDYTVKEFVSNFYGYEIIATLKTGKGSKKINDTIEDILCL